MPAEALAVDWQSIRDAAIAGVSYQELATQWGLTTPDGKTDTSAIRQRSKRENWPMPHKVIARAKELEEQRRASLRPLTRNTTASHETQDELSHNVTNGLKPLEMAAISINERVDNFAANVVTTLCDNGNAALKSTPSLFIPKDLDQLHKIVSTVFKASGRDKPAQFVVSFGALSSAGQAGPAIRDVGPAQDDAQGWTEGDDHDA